MNRDSKVSRNPKIVARELGAPQGAVLLHLETGAYHGLNPVGFVVWELIDDRRTVADLVDGVRDRIKNDQLGRSQMRRTAAGYPGDSQAV